jgi:hypothetical protein
VTPSDTAHGQIALKFGRALADEDFDLAYSLLAPGLLVDLESELGDMISYGSGPITYVEVMTEMTSWKAKSSDDIGWAYVALSGEDFAEAVAVVVSNVGETAMITKIEWGRP